MCESLLLLVSPDANPQLLTTLNYAHTQDTYYMDYIAESITGSRSKWQHILLLDAMLCAIDNDGEDEGLGVTRFDPDGERFYCHHTTFYESVLLALELCVQNDTAACQVDDCESDSM